MLLTLVKIVILNFRSQLFGLKKGEDMLGVEIKILRKFFFVLIFFLQSSNLYGWVYGAYGVERLPYLDLAGHLADSIADLRYGFSISEGIATVRTSLPVKEVITFGKKDAALNIMEDLRLDSNVTLSFWYDGVNGNKGYISGNGHSIILNGDLVLPDNCSLIFLTNTKIDGQGKLLLMGDNAQLIVDSDITLTLKNLIFDTGINSADKPPIKMFLDSKLSLQNTSIVLGDDFVFDGGDLFIHGNVSVSGPHEFIYSSTYECFIAKNSTLKFGLDSEFTYSPYCNDRDLIVMKDATSKLFFKNSSLNMSYTAPRLTKGNLIFDKRITVSTTCSNVEVDFSTNYLSNLTFEDWSLNMNYPGVNGLYSVNYSPDSRYLAVGGQFDSLSRYGKVYPVYLDGTLGGAVTIPYLGTIWPNCIKFSPDGKFLVVGGTWNDSGGYAKIYPFNSDGTLGTAVTIPYQDDVRSIAFSSSGKFLAIGGNWNDGGYYGKIYPFNFDGTVGTPTVIPYMDEIYQIKFSPDDKYLVVGGDWNDGGGVCKIYKFLPEGGIGNSYTIPSFSSPHSLNFSNDGRFFVISGNIGGNPTSKIYFFESNGTLRWIQDIPEIGLISAMIFSPDNRFLYFGTQYYVSSVLVSKLLIYKVSSDGTMQFERSWNLDSVMKEADFSSDERYLAAVGRRGTAPYYALFQIFSFYPDYGQNRWATFTFGDVGSLGQAIWGNALTFGNSALGNSYNLKVDVLAGAKIDLYSKLNIDNVA